jgi:phospholipid-binding lipoprotein MlaA
MSKNWFSARWALSLCVLGAVLLGGCAAGPNAHPKDPLEPFNRGVSNFNEGLDKAVLKPVATVYQDVTPDVVRTGVGNFFGNLSDAWSALNALLQVRPREAAENFMRFNVNTFLGFAGLLDIASEMGIERTKLDFGQTLGRWGVPAGPYLVLPVFGPSSVRDAAGLMVDGQGDLVTAGSGDTQTRTALSVLRLTEKRATLLGAGDLLDEAALDKYTFVRDAYLQRRENSLGLPQKEERFDLD